MALGRIAAVILLCSCGAPAPAPVPPTAPAAARRLALRPALRPGAVYHYRISLTIDATLTARGVRQHSQGTLELDDKVDVVSATAVRDTCSNAAAHGDGDVGEGFQRFAPLLSGVAVTTTFDAAWHPAEPKIEGTTSDDLRTMIGNIAPVLSFRVMPAAPVAIGDTWKPAGDATSSLLYTLRAVAPCGARTCATIAMEGDEPAPPQNGATGTVRYTGSQVVEAESLVPIEKTIEATTLLRGEQQGEAFEYVTIATARVVRADR